MFELFTDRARRAIVLAQEHARILRHEQITCGHILLALHSEGESIAAKVLAEAAPLEDFLKLVQPTRKAAEDQPKNHLPFSADTKHVLEQARREALQLGHNYIGCEHLLLALLRSPGDDVDNILTLVGISPTALKAAVVHAVTEAEPPRPPAAPPPELVVITGSVPLTIERMQRIYRTLGGEEVVITATDSDHQICSWIVTDQTAADLVIGQEITVSIATPRSPS